jgi:hypothetical protein
MVPSSHTHRNTDVHRQTARLPDCHFFFARMPRRVIPYCLLHDGSNYSCLARDKNKYHKNIKFVQNDDGTFVATNTARQSVLGRGALTQQAKAIWDAYAHLRDKSRACVCHVGIVCKVFVLPIPTVELPIPTVPIPTVPIPTVEEHTVDKDREVMARAVALAFTGVGEACAWATARNRLASYKSACQPPDVPDAGEKHCHVCMVSLDAVMHFSPQVLPSLEPCVV